MASHFANRSGLSFFFFFCINFDLYFQVLNKHIIGFLLMVTEAVSILHQELPQGAKMVT